MTTVGLCEACTWHVVRALREMPTDYTELHLLLASGETGITSDMVMGSRELQVPIRVSIEALQASMLHELQAWAEPAAERLGIAWDTGQVRHCRPGWVLQRCSQLLGRSVDVLLDLPEQEYRYAMDSDWIVRDGIGGALELARMHDMVRFAAGKTKLVHRLPTPCPRCERETLCRYNGTEHVICESCAAFWPNDQYKRLCLVLAEDYREFEPERVHVSMCASLEGTTGSRPDDTVNGRVVRAWPRMPMVEFPADVA